MKGTMSLKKKKLKSCWGKIERNKEEFKSKSKDILKKTSFKIGGRIIHSQS